MAYVQSETISFGAKMEHKETKKAKLSGDILRHLNQKSSFPDMIFGWSRQDGSEAS
ncbi:uncharacterized protein M6B38_387385 [Iris pallida]|uniref:Uncharacterized protein n=1 Tax=Iris pallida TaxID=29817 RepID=A0AAX6G2N8_IRIPA|nr:uncharacterized protein M6B38_387385 [Iris pallida]